MVDLTHLVSQFARLPGIGKKSAARITAYLLKNRQKGFELADVIKEVLENIANCSLCGNYTTVDPCPICADQSRDDSIICVVEETGDVQAIEESGYFKGYYHILMGSINPLDGIGPDKLRIKELVERLEAGSFEEILIATNPTVEGEATYLYLQSILANRGYRISRIATGLPMGGSLEYADRLTIRKALQSKLYSNES